MDVRGAIKGQYHAALAMLRKAIEKCPEELWVREEGEVAFWRVVYHTLYFTALYLQKDAKSFAAWEKHRAEFHHLRINPRLVKKGVTRSKGAKPLPAYTREEMLEYLEDLDGRVDGLLDAMDLEAKRSGFWWYMMPKLDHQLVNIRHVQHHAGILGARLRRETGRGPGWVGKAAAAK
jgi:hypothetical protein